MLNFATSSVPDFPFQAFTDSKTRKTFSEDYVYEHSLNGYKSLIRAGVFHINSDGYPELTMRGDSNFDDVLWAIDAIRTFNQIVLIDLTMMKLHAAFIIIKSPTCSVVFMRRKDEYFMISMTEIIDVGITVMRLFTQPMQLAVDKNQTATIIVRMMNRAGRVTAHTRILYERADGYFHESKPTNIKLVGEVMRWPAKYTLAALLDRIVDIVNMGNM